jgi:hypothetical protein
MNIPEKYDDQKHQRRVRQALIALGWKAEGISRRN